MNIYLNPDKINEDNNICGVPQEIFDIMNAHDEGPYIVGKILDPIATSVGGTSDHESGCNFWYFDSHSQAAAFVKRVNIHLNRCVNHQLVANDLITVKNNNVDDESIGHLLTSMIDTMTYDEMIPHVSQSLETYLLSCDDDTITKLLERHSIA